MVVGVLQWKDPRIPAFPSENRQDFAFEQALIIRGIPEENIELLLDEKATWSGIKNAFRRVGERAQEGDTLLFYYAGHGKDSAKGVRFAEYDAKLGGGFPLPVLGELITQTFRGEKILLFADCCFSGGLVDLAEELQSQGFRSAAVTSAPNCAPSGPTWAYTMALIEAFRAKRSVDRDLDHRIRLKEVQQEVHDVLKYTAFQESGFGFKGLDPNFVLSSVTTIDVRPRVPAPYRIYDYLDVKLGQSWRPVRLLGFHKNLLKLQLQGYSSRSIVWAPVEATRPSKSKIVPFVEGQDSPVHAAPPVW